MAADTRRLYAKTLALTLIKDFDTYTMEMLNRAVQGLPFGEMHVERENIWLENLPLVGFDVSLETVARNNFFDVVHGVAKTASSLTRPFLIAKSHVEALGQWDDWMTLESYLETMGLQPTVAFRNKAIDPRGRKAPHFIADLRVMFRPGPDIVKPW